MAPATRYSSSAPTTFKAISLSTDSDQSSAPTPKRRKSVQFDLGHNQQRRLPRDSGRVWKKLEKQIFEKGLNTPESLAFGDYFICERGGHAQVIVSQPPPAESMDPSSIFAMDEDVSSTASLDSKLAQLSLNKQPNHSILHYPEDNNMYIDWDQVDNMVNVTNSLPDDLSDIDLGIKPSKRRSHKHQTTLLVAPQYQCHYSPYPCQNHMNMSTYRTLHNLNMLMAATNQFRY